MALYCGEVRESRRRLEPVPATAQMQLTEPQQDELERCARSRSVAARAVQRAKIILGLTAGKTKKEIAQQLGISAFRPPAVFWSRLDRAAEPPRRTHWQRVKIGLRYV